MIKDEIQKIKHNDIEYNCPYVVFNNPIQKKWTFVIGGHDSEIYHGQKIEFLDTEMDVCFTNRRDAENPYLIRKGFKVETVITAWV